MSDRDSEDSQSRGRFDLESNYPHYPPHHVVSTTPQVSLPTNPHDPSKI